MPTTAEQPNMKRLLGGLEILGIDASIPKDELSVIKSCMCYNKLWRRNLSQEEDDDDYLSDDVILKQSALGVIM